MWQIDRKTSIRRRISFPVCSSVIRFFKLDASKKLLCLISIFYILACATHFKKYDLERSNKNIVTLKIAAAGTIDYIKALISIFSNRRFGNNFTGNIFIQQAVNCFINFLR